ncbi:MAG: 5'/3'-nucleotidase SurE [Phycisphaerae bacterium]
MRILISNDDGILAPGLAALVNAVKDLGEVTVVAPDSHQSAASQAITVFHPLTVHRVRIEGAEGFTGFSVDGRPADCVRLAIRKMLPEPPDLVLSGINAGANVGAHVSYSGTVAAAAEARLCGIPAVAFSACMASGEVDFPNAASFCRMVLDRLLQAGLNGQDLINVNIPDESLGEPRGVRVVPQSPADLEEVYHKVSEHDGCEIYELRDFQFAPGEADNDVDSIAAGFISVTPLIVDRTCHPRLESLSECDFGGITRVQN